MYTWNDEAEAFWREEGILKNTVPLELNEGELKHRDNRSSEILLYGYIPLMISAQCVRCLLYTSPSPRDGLLSRMPSSA